MLDNAPWLPLLIPLAGMIVLMVTARNRRFSRRIDMMGGGDRRLPSAQATALSIARFQKAAQKYLLVDTVWNHYRRGELIFLPEPTRDRKSGPAPGR